MKKIKIFVKSVYNEDDSFVLKFKTDWIGDLTLSKTEFDNMGRPTAGDELLVVIQSLERSLKHERF